jgi:4-hydroxybenzoyl-CoA thioesterase
MRSYEYRVQVEWGDCDPAQIVFYPHYYRWMDEATLHLFDEVGLGWNDLQEKYGVPGLPLISTHADFKVPVMFGDKLVVHAGVSEWGSRSLTVSHTFMKGNRVAVEGWEKRVWARPDPDQPGRLIPFPIPDEVKAKLA